jgi:hypothetical protein
VIILQIWSVSSPDSTITLSADLCYIIKDIGQFLISDSQDGTTKVRYKLNNTLMCSLFCGSLDHVLLCIKPSIILFHCFRFCDIDLGLRDAQMGSDVQETCKA